MNHRAMRQLIHEGFRRRFGREATRPEAQCCHAVAQLETSCGEGWRPPGDGSHNYGAIQAGSGWSGKTFQYTDTSPNADGSSTPYVTKFRKYETPQHGADDLVRVVYQVARKIDGQVLDRAKLVLVPAGAGDTLAFSRGLYATGYYEGFGRGPEERIGHHHKAVRDALVTIARELGEPLPDGSDPPAPPPRMLRLLTPRMFGEDVAAMQRVIGAKADGVFGPLTHAVLVSWQRQHRLKPDGVWGPASRLVAAAEGA